MILEALIMFSSWKFLLLGTFSLIVVWLVYNFLQEQFSPLQNIPCPPGALPLIGHSLTLLRCGSLLDVVRTWTEQFPSMFVLHLGLRLGVVGGHLVYVTDPELIRFVTVKNAHKFERSEFLAKIIPSLRKGVFVSVGKAHTRQKRLISPAFSLAHLKGFLNIFQENSEKLVQLWSDQLTKVQPECSFERDINKDMHHLSLDLIGESAFGYSFNTILGGSSKVSEAFTVLFLSFNITFLVCKFLFPFFDYLPLAENRKIQAAKEITDNTVLEVIQERRRQKSEGNAPVKRDLLALLMDMYDEETNSRMNDEELRSQVFTFILAGSETTNVALAWTLYELAKNPHIQQKLRTEIQATFTRKEELTWEKLEKMQYLGNVVKESLRLHAPADVTSRVATSDVEIGGYFVPAGTYVVLPIDSTQRSSHFWSNPLAFDPERFVKNDGQESVHPFAYFPFGCGPRMCIGNKFAVMVMKVVLVTLVKNFSFHEVPNCVVNEVNRVSTRPDGLKLCINLVENVDKE